MKIIIIAARDEECGIGRHNSIPWLDKHSDLKFFAEKTRGQTVIMGRRTWESLPDYKLKDRNNIIITSKALDTESDEQVSCFPTWSAAIKNVNTEYAYIIGGEQLYNFALPYAHSLYITNIPGTYNCDKFFKFDDNEWVAYRSMNANNLIVKNYIRYNHAITGELEYLKLMSKLLDATPKHNRTGIDTLSLFGQTLRYKLSDEHGCPIVPIMTSKRVPFRLVYSELLWFIAGGTNTDMLLKNNNHIWDGNSTELFLRARGLNYRAGQLGPVYGAQWRHFGGQYDAERDIMTGGVDQLAELLKNIRQDPDSRRHVLSAWNPADLDKMALPPCHFASVFTVTNGVINCMLILRSNDMFLGHPFNMASYSILTHILAHMCGLQAGELVISMADCHIYTSHIKQIEKQLEQEIFPFPRLKINGNPQEWDEWDMNSIELIGYKHGSHIPAPMAV